MEQHPVPQNISSYQFHLVGDMTLKQFLQLAGGVVLGLLVYATGLPGFIKWPLIAFFALSGAALAFLPFEERPLSRWVIAFFRSVYSPTLYYWQRTSPAPVYFQLETAPQPLRVAASPFSKIPFLKNLEDKENSILTNITQLFTPTAGVATPTPPPASPQPAPHQIFNQVQSFEEKVILQKKPITIEVPTPGLVAVEKQKYETARPTFIVEEGQGQNTQVAQTLVGQTQPTQSVVAQFSPDAAPPLLPATPNVIVGQVMDPDGRIVEGAILEVKDVAGRPVRALKTNKAGHFLTVTPLIDGHYEIIAEKEGLIFDPISFEANGKLIAPIALRAKGRIAKVEEI